MEVMKRMMIHKLDLLYIKQMIYNITKSNSLPFSEAAMLLNKSKTIELDVSDKIL